MAPRTDLVFPTGAAVAVVTVAVIFGGAFLPHERALVGGLLMIAWLLVALEWPFRGSLVELLILAIPVWGALTAIWVGAAPLAAKETVTSWVIAWVLWSLFRGAGRRSRELALRVLVVGVAVVVVAIGFEAVVSRSIRVGGVFDNPNLAAAILVAALPVGLVVFDSRRLRLGWVVLVASALLVTGSRAGLLAAVVAAGVMLPRGRVRLLGILGGSTVGLAVLVWRFVSQPDLLAWHRLAIWRAAVKIWSSRPWTGVGPGGLVEAAGSERILHADQVGRYQFVISFSESTPLAVLVQLGAVGVVLAGGAAMAWWLAARRRGAFEPATLSAGLAAVVTLSLFHDVLTLPVVLWWWAVVLGCLEADGAGGEEEQGRGSLWGTRAAVGLALVWLTAWGVVAPAAARWKGATVLGTTGDVEMLQRLEPWYAEPVSARVRRLLEAGDSWSWIAAAEALTWAKTAVEIHPGLAGRWVDLGRVHTRILTDLGGTEHDVEGARRAMERACELDPHLPWHWLERARLERVLDRPGEAVRLTRRALEEEPNTVRGWLMLSRLELEQGRVTQARSAYREAIARSKLIDRPGLTDYEHELLTTPVDLVASIERQLFGDVPGAL